MHNFASFVIDCAQDLKSVIFHKTKLCSTKIMPKSIQLRTFRSWNVDDVLISKKTEIDGVVKVTKLYCKMK